VKVYLDHNATTPLHPNVLAAMLPFLGERFGNPSSGHAWGREARQALEASRQEVAGALGVADKDCIVFTGGGTEANNLALTGVVTARTDRPRHLIISAVEHPAVLHTADHLERQGCAVTRLSVDREGVLDPDDVRRAIRPDTVLVSLMHANNETGVLFPIAEVAQVCRERGVLLHTDAIQSFGKIPVDIEALGVDLLSISGHKLHGPKGIGALYVRRGTKMVPVIHGGGQERSRRGGTENVAGAVGLARAANLMGADLGEASRRIAELRDRLETVLMATGGAGLRNGHHGRRLPHTSNLAFPGVEAESLVIALDLQGVAVSSGAACSSGAVEPSHVLLAMGVSPDHAQSSVRFSLGRWTTSGDVAYVGETVLSIVERMRGANRRQPEHARSAA
jgi:cysteine desulfurase